MASPWNELLVLAAAAGWAAPMMAQDGRELGLQAIVTASDPVLAVAGAYGALRTSARTRVSAGIGAGASDGELAWRGELLGHFLLSPGQRRGAAFYFAGGVAVVDGPVDRGYLTLTLGLENRPAESSGWAAEIGVGGGVRVALGYRWRWFRHSLVP